MTDITIATTGTASSRRYLIATGGTCLGNPGPGAWGAKLISFEGPTVRATKCLSGVKRHTNNIVMEVLAAIKALSWLPVNDVPAHVQSNSQYVIKGMTEWRATWEQNGWVTSAGKPVKNEDLWRALIDAVGDREVTWEWVRGHDGHEGNEAAHKLAHDALDRALKRQRS